jgi:hypothetical protein
MGGGLLHTAQSSSRPYRPRLQVQNRGRHAGLPSMGDGGKHFLCIRSVRSAQAAIEGAAMGAHTQGTDQKEVQDVRSM